MILSYMKTTAWRKFLHKIILYSISITTSMRVIASRKKKMEDGNINMSLKEISSQKIFGYGIKRNSSFRLSSRLLFYMDVRLGIAIYPKIQGVI